jgi:uncharacterized protein (TIGR03435 family)
MTAQTKRLVIAAVLSMSGVAVYAQSAGPAFDVAAIKPHDPSDSRSGNFFQGTDRWIASNYTLRQLIRTAYQVQEYRVIGGPEWVDREHYDIDARVAPADARTPGLANRLAMIRTLLADRFQLRVREEQRELPVYVLELARQDRKLGASLRAVARRDCASDAPDGWCGIRGQGPGKVAGQQVTIDTFVIGLAGAVDRVVLNDTGLTGVFDFSLEYTPTAADLTNPTVTTDAGGAPSIFTALNE